MENVTEELSLSQCPQCNTVVALNSSFCNHCGARQISSEQLPTENKWKLLKQAGLFYALDLGICCLFKFIDYFHTLGWLTAIHIAGIVITCIFLSIDYKKSLQLLNWKNFKAGKLALCMFGAGLASTAVSFSVGWLNHIIFPKTVFYDVIFTRHHHPYLLIILYTAVIPALFEELAYRGYMLQTLLEVMDKQQAVFITSFLFAIIHLSFLSLFWLIPFALLLGYIRVNTNTIWYGVAIHFCFNLTACLIDLFVK